ncbi:GIY-YIG nuclease family protein [Flavobacterium sp.]|uniref:GIY-YIG nuclease family protein n=1 Tax=Flavobacterium sp. TaxID=239 RepID=UPI0026049196|nr:GIY-YIG nuclease family protein [Flavobacterium sp.]
MFQTEGYHRYYVYIVTNKNKTVLYTGVTNNLKRRLREHKEQAVKGNASFASKYNAFYLLYFEKFTWIQEAIAREKEIKQFRRKEKEDLILRLNPYWIFLNYLFDTPKSEK